MASAQPDRSSARQYSLLALKIAVSIILLTILFSKIDVGQLWSGVQRASFVWLGGALALYFVNVLASMWRWHVLLTAQSVHIQRLVKVTDDPILEGAAPDKLVGIGGHKDGWNGMAGVDEPPVELVTVHGRHMDIGNQAGGFAEPGVA